MAEFLSAVTAVLALIAWAAIYDCTGNPRAQRIVKYVCVTYALLFGTPPLVKLWFAMVLG